MKCDPDLLWTLVQQEPEPGREAESIARHLESCSACQCELERIGGDQSWWSDAQKWLGQGETESTVDTETQAEEIPTEISAAAPPVDLSFLQPASHPEMLGRIGRYDVEGLLGRGGMGVVLRAYDQDLRRSVAVKVLAPEWAASPQARQRFAREAQAAASVAHENVIPIYNVESDASLPYLVMRYVPGMTLERWVSEEGPPDVATILRIASQMAEGLAAAHRRGLIHRDIKPGNILVGQNVDRVWITDFGLARAADSITLTRTGVIAGTPHYMSPEQARGESIDHRSDLFSLGCVLYFLAVGRPPFDAENTLAVLHQIVSKPAAPLSMHRDDLPPSYVTLVSRLLHRSPDRRPESAAAVSESLDRAQREFNDGRTAKKPMLNWHRDRWWAGAMAACLVLTVGYGFWITAEERSDSSVTAPEPLADQSIDPFSAQNPLSDATVYEVEASKRIDAMVATDTTRIDRELGEIRRDLEGWDDASPSALLSPLSLGGSDWNQSVSKIQQSIQRLESNDHP